MMQSRLYHAIPSPLLLDVHMFSPLPACQAVNNLTSVSIQTHSPRPPLPQQARAFANVSYAL